MQRNQIYLIVLLIILLFAVLPGQITGSLSVFVIFILFFIGLISMAGIIVESQKAAYGLNLIHWIFVFIFFFIAPIIQATFSFQPWGISMDSLEIEKTGLYIILWIIMYVIGTVFARHIYFRESEKIKYISDGRLRLCLYISIISSIIIIRNTGFRNLFTRAEVELAASSLQISTAVSLVLSKCTRAAIVFLEAVLISERKTMYRNVNILLLINSVLLILTCFPTALARNTTATVYLGLFVFLFYRNKQILKNSLLYIFSFLGGILIVFPILSIFRRMTYLTPNLLVSLENSLTNLGSAYLSADYDAFAIITATRQHVDQYGITMGRQLLGALLFFIPRSIWSSKPIGSGAFVATSRGMRFTNISCPLVAEGYINFGIIGICIFALIAGTACTILDEQYWSAMESTDSGISFIEIIYPFMLPSYFFILRGDMMSGWAYIFAFILIFYILFPKINGSLN